MIITPLDDYWETRFQLMRKWMDWLYSILCIMHHNVNGPPGRDHRITEDGQRTIEQRIDRPKDPSWRSLT